MPKKFNQRQSDLSANIGLGTDEALIVRKAYKRFSMKTIVLNGLDMTVQRGTIYGFLGPSGCGKTTLLSCIVGRTTLDAGVIRLCVNSRSKIGYMPQDLSLHKEFSIEETVSYYGYLYGIRGDELKKRKEYLYSFLNLPNEKQVIATLSGGQQRRTSLCVTLLHNPEILILDEPTCGVDPVLSHTIWQHLVTMSTQEDKTIIITTHYIEEARQANRIGLMRGGVILGEGTPEQLMASYHCETLEKVFLKLSQMQAENYDAESQVVQEYPRPNRKPRVPVELKKSVSPKHVNSHLVKSYYWMKRNLPILGFLLFLPFIQCVLFHFTIGLDPEGLKVGYVNFELTGGRSSSCSEPVPVNGSYCYLEHDHISCLLLKKFEKKKMDLIEFSDTTSAKMAAIRNDIWGYFYIDSNYSTALRGRINHGRDAPPEQIDQSEINIHMDMSNQYIGNLLRRDLYYAYEDFLIEVHESCKLNRKLATTPIAWQDAIYGSNNPRFSDFAVPAIVLLFEFYLPMMFTVGAILMEKREGLLERSLICGMNFTEVLVGHAIVQAVVLALQTIIMLMVLYVMFDHQIVGNFALTLALLVVTGICGMCYGFLVSAVCDSDQAATYMGLGSFFPLVVLSGMIWPSEGMHWVLKSISYALPLTLSTEAFRAVASRGWDMTYFNVYAGFISAAAWTVIFIIGTYGIVKVKRFIIQYL